MYDIKLKFLQMHAQQGLEHTVTQNKRFCCVNNKPHTPLDTSTVCTQLSKPTNLTRILGLRLQEFHAGACKLSYTLWGDNTQSCSTKKPNTHIIHKHTWAARSHTQLTPRYTCCGDQCVQFVAANPHGNNQRSRSCAYVYMCVCVCVCVCERERERYSHFIHVQYFDSYT